MRPLRADDLLIAAELLAAAPPRRRRRLARALLARAAAADRHRLRHGRLHPRWGNGTLLAAALSCRCPRRQGLDCAALVMLISEISGNSGPGHNAVPCRAGNGE